MEAFLDRFMCSQEKLIDETARHNPEMERISEKQEMEKMAARQLARGDHCADYRNKEVDYRSHLFNTYKNMMKKMNMSNKEILEPFPNMECFVGKESH